MKNENPLLSQIKLPGETYRLPSSGLFYTDDELDEDVRNGEVHVYPMTAIDEIAMKSPDMLFSGKAVHEVFQRCVPQILRPGRLLAKDVDFLIICLRKVSFGDEMEIVYKHDCEEAEEHSYVIPVVDLIKAAKLIDPSSLGAFTVSLENGQKVTIEPIRFDAYTQLLQSNEDQERSAEDWKNVMLDSFRDVIHDVDGTTDKDLIGEWLNEIPAGWLRKISDAVDKTSDWGPSFDTTVVCRDCGEKITVTTPLNPIAFFS